MAKEKPSAKKEDKADKDNTRKNSKKKVAKKAKVAKKSQPKKAKPKAAKSKPSKPKKQITPDERLEMIRTAAYYLAEKRGYHGENELGDWFEAEKEIDALSSDDV